MLEHQAHTYTTESSSQEKFGIIGIGPGNYDGKTGVAHAVIADPGAVMAFKSTPSNCVFFSNAEGKQIGCLDFSADRMTFEGEADESAKLFIASVLKLMPHIARQFNQGDTA